MKAPYKRIRLAKGATTPFKGVLMSDAALAQIITDLEKKAKLAALAAEKVKRELTAERKSNATICQAKITAEQSKLKGCNDDKERQRVIYESALKKCDKNAPWYKSPFFGYVMGNVVAGGVCAAVSASR